MHVFDIAGLGFCVSLYTCRWKGECIQSVSHCDLLSLHSPHFVCCPTTSQGQWTRQTCTGCSTAAHPSPPAGMESSCCSWWCIEAATKWSTVSMAPFFATFIRSNNACFRLNNIETPPATTTSHEHANKLSPLRTLIGFVDLRRSLTFLRWKSTVPFFMEDIWKWICTRNPVMNFRIGFTARFHEITELNWIRLEKLIYFLN